MNILVMPTEDPAQVADLIRDAEVTAGTNADIIADALLDPDGKRDEEEGA